MDQDLIFSTKPILNRNQLQNQNPVLKDDASTQLEPSPKMQRNIMLLQNQGPLSTCFWLPPPKKQTWFKKMAVQRISGPTFAML